MSGLYVIPLSVLKAGTNNFDFEIGREFFESFEESEIREGQLRVSVVADKGSSHVDLEIRIEGEVSVCCDRCLEMFGFPLECVNRLLIRYGRERDEADPVIIMLPADEHELDIKQYLYEFIHLALPIKRVHPDDENGASSCDPLMIEKLNKHLVSGNGTGDARWDGLKQLMIDN
ncbi:MAG: DUF177 domain-containing protein [Bacteroidales bacterium]|nr:DUF177 domain-containing protein [Bacteroidales bacterium]